MKGSVHENVISANLDGYDKRVVNIPIPNA